MKESKQNPWFYKEPTFSPTYVWISMLEQRCDEKTTEPDPTSELQDIQWWNMSCWVKMSDRMWLLMWYTDDDVCIIATFDPTAELQDIQGRKIIYITSTVTLYHSFALKSIYITIITFDSTLLLMPLLLLRPCCCFRRVGGGWLLYEAHKVVRIVSYFIESLLSADQWNNVTVDVIHDYTYVVTKEYGSWPQLMSNT